MKKADINIDGEDKAKEIEGKDENGTETPETGEIKEKPEIVEKKEKDEKKKEGKYKVLLPFFYKRRYEEGEFSDFTKKEAEELLKEELIEEV